MLTSKVNYNRGVCDICPRKNTDRPVQVMDDGRAGEINRSDRVKGDSEHFGSKQNSQVTSRGKHGCLSHGTNDSTGRQQKPGTEDGIKGRQQTTLLLGQTPQQSPLVGQCDDWQKLWPLHKTDFVCRRNRHCSNADDKQNRRFYHVEKYAENCKEQLNQEHSHKSTQPSVVCGQRIKNWDMSGTQQRIGSDSTSGDLLIKNTNNSSLNNKTPAESPGSNYQNIPLSDKSILPPSQALDSPSGYLLLGPDQIDMLLALAVSNYTGTDMVECCKLALQSGNLDNILRNYLVAVKYRLYDVMDKIINVIRRNFLCIAQTKEFLSLPLEFALIFMEDSFLNVDNELDMFVTALSWIDYNKQERIPQAGPSSLHTDNSKSVLTCAFTPHKVDISTVHELRSTGEDSIMCTQESHILHHVYTQLYQTPPDFTSQIPPRRKMPGIPDRTSIVSDSVNFGPETQRPQGKSNNLKTQGPQGKSRNPETKKEAPPDKSLQSDKQKLNEQAALRAKMTDKAKVTFATNESTSGKGKTTASASEKPSSNDKKDKSNNFSLEPKNHRHGSRTTNDAAAASLYHTANGEDVPRCSTATKMFHNLSSRSRSKCFNILNGNPWHEPRRNVQFPGHKCLPERGPAVARTERAVGDLTTHTRVLGSGCTPSQHGKTKGAASLWSTTHSLHSASIQRQMNPKKQSHHQVFKVTRAMSGPVITVMYPEKDGTLSL